MADSRLNEAKALGVLDASPGKWFCASCWREAVEGAPETDARLSALARSKIRPATDYEVDTSGRCDIFGTNCQTKNEAFYKHGGRALAVRRRAEPAECRRP